MSTTKIFRNTIKALTDEYQKEAKKCWERKDYQGWQFYSAKTIAIRELQEKLEND